MFKSTSVSFVKTFPDNGVSSGVESDSLITTGGSLTGVIPIVSVAVSEAPFPSVIV